MRAVIQRVKSAVIDIDDNGKKSRKEIGQGLVILIGIDVNDTEENMQKLAEKCRGIRIFCDENDKMNLSVNDIGGSVLIVSNFTLCADTSHGKRPSFINAARPEQSEPLYERFVELFCEHTPTVTGVFGADMQINLVNDGPVTIVIDA